MKKFMMIAFMASMIGMMTSCSVVEGIFKAGVWSGVLLVVVVVALVIWILVKLFGGGRNS